MKMRCRPGRLPGGCWGWPPAASDGCPLPGEQLCLSSGQMGSLVGAGFQVRRYAPYSAQLAWLWFPRERRLLMRLRLSPLPCRALALGHLACIRSLGHSAPQSAASTGRPGGKGHAHGRSCLPRDVWMTTLLSLQE